jgi:hypothetical protein
VNHSVATLSKKPESLAAYGPDAQVQILTQHLPRTVKANFYCRLAEAEALRRFCRTHLLDLSHQEHRAKVIGQGFYGGLQKLQ